MNINLFLASPRGFCAGVHRAIKIVDLALENYSVPIYVNHEIIHNKYIIKHFEGKGVIFGEKVENIPAGEIIIFSAHGVGPKFIDKVKTRGLRYIDASCPLVLKVHTEARNFLKKGYEIIYIGKHYHQEAEGVKEENPDKIHIVSNYDEFIELSKTLKNTDKLALLTQTTLSVHETNNLIKSITDIFPNIEIPKKGDICYATTNRQNAVKLLCEKIDILIIVGSQNSSNSRKLAEIGEKRGIPSMLIDSASEIDTKIIESIHTKNLSVNIGLSSGASAPEKLISEVIGFLKELGVANIQDINFTKENMNFPISDVIAI